MIKRKNILKMSLFFFICSFLLSGCTIFSFEKVSPEDEKQLTEDVIQYVKDTHQKDFFIIEINKVNYLFSEQYFIFGVVKDDEENIPIIVSGKQGNFRDTYEFHRLMFQSVQE